MVSKDNGETLGWSPPGHHRHPLSITHPGDGNNALLLGSLSCSLSRRIRESPLFHGCPVIPGLGCPDLGVDRCVPVCQACPRSAAPVLWMEEEEEDRERYTRCCCAQGRCNTNSQTPSQGQDGGGMETMDGARRHR